MLGRLQGAGLILMLLTSMVTAQDVSPQGTSMQTRQTVAKKVIATRQTQFPIPFEIAPSLQGNTKEVELVYSIDQGDHWYSYQKAPPDQKKFQFYAKNDGEYWFIFRLINHQGEAKLAQAEIPSVRVLVDTQPPKLQFEAKRSKSGEVVISWNVEDVALASETPEIYLSYDLNVTWIRLATDPAKIKKSENGRSGETIFYPPTGTKMLDVRCEMSDSSGNKEIKTVKLDFNAAAGTESMTAQSEKSKDEVLPVFPPRPTLKKEASKETVSAQSEKSIKSIPDLLTGPEINTLQNAETLPRYAHSASDGSTAVDGDSKSSDLDLSLLDSMLELDGNRETATPAPVVVLPGGKIGDQTVVPLPPVTQEVEVKKSEIVPTTPPTAETVKPEPVFPGKITLVSLKESVTPSLVIRWYTGDASLSQSKVDIYRSTSNLGPWQPVIYDLNNSGEYLWNITESEFTPFYLRVDLRSVQGLYTDFTTREINLLNAMKPK